MEKIVLNKRELTGNRASKLLAKGFVPAVIYNEKTESFNIQITVKEANWLIANTTSTTILDADLNGKMVKAVVKDVDYNPQTGEIRHIAFFQIDETKEMVFTVPFTLTGISPAVKNNLGILVKTLSSIDVKCKLANLVPEIVIDISEMEHPGQTISVADIKLPKGMTLPNEEHANNAIVTITQLQKVEELMTTPATGETATETEAKEGETATAA